METRANYVAVGAFVVVLLVAAAGVMMWVIGSQFNTKQAYFHMSFAGSVSGLTKDAAVRYNGVPVGKVTVIAIDNNNPNHITVVVALDPRYRHSPGRGGLAGVPRFDWRILRRDQRRHPQRAAFH